MARWWTGRVVISMSCSSAGVTDHCFTRAHGQPASNRGSSTLYDLQMREISCMIQADDLLF
jgi:hypothetical protein